MTSMTSVFYRNGLNKINSALLIVALFTLTFGSLASLTLGLESPASSTNLSISAGPGHRKISSGVSGSNSPVSYYNWSGYAASSSQPFVSVESTYVQPAVSCPVPGAWTVFWVGFDGFTNGTVEQAGTAAQCSYDSVPSVSYYTWWEMWPTNTIQIAPVAVKPGDTIKASVTYSASNSTYSMSVVNQSTRKQFTQNSQCASNLVCSRQSAEWIVERPTLSTGSYTPLANWGTMDLANDLAANTFTISKGKGRNSTATPVMQPASAFSNTPINMVGYSYNTLATVGSLNSSGDQFSDTWTAAQ